MGDWLPSLILRVGVGQVPDHRELVVLLLTVADVQSGGQLGGGGAV